MELDFNKKFIRVIKKQKILFINSIISPDIFTKKLKSVIYSQSTRNFKNFYWPFIKLTFYGSKVKKKLKLEFFA